MPQTSPFHSLVPRKISKEELIRAIRLEIESELDAVNLYEAHIESTDDADAKKVLAFIAGEEKEHAAIFLALLRRLDGKLDEEMEVGAKKLDLILRGASKEEIEAAEEAGLQ